MDLWESVSDQYKEAAKSAFPLHRLFTAAVVFIGVIASRNQTHLSIFETIAKISIKDLSFEDGGFFASALIEDALWGILFAFLGWVGSRIALKVMFNWIAKLVNFDAKAIPLPQKDQRSIEDIKAITELLNESIAPIKKRLNTLSSLSEALFGCAFASLAAYHWGNALDLVIFFGLFIVATILHGIAIKIFLSDYLGPALYKSGLLGIKPPHLNEVGD